MNKFTGILLVAGCCYVSSCSLLRAVTGRKSSGADTVATTATIDTVKKVAVVPPPDTVKKVPDVSAVQKQAIDRMTPTWNKRVSFTSFSGKAKMRFDGPDQKQEFTAHIRVRKDSAIWINITALGGVVQAARIFVTPDSFFMRNDQEKTITRIALKDAAKILPARVDFSALQNFIIGDPLRGGEIKSVDEDATAWTVTVEDTAYVQHYTYNKADTTLIRSQLNTHNPSGPQATTSYSSYLNVDGRKLSSLRALIIQKGADSTWALDINFTKIDLDQQLEYPFSVPPSYEVK